MRSNIQPTDYMSSELYQDGNVDTLDANSDHSQEQVEDRYNFNDKTFQQEAVRKIISRENKHKDYYKKLKDRTNDNRKYWQGNQIDNRKLNIGESALVVNKVFSSIETIVPIATRRVPEPNVTVYPRFTRQSRLLEDKITRFLKDKWSIFNKMPQQMQSGVRNLLQAGYVIGKYYWDDDINQMKFKLLPPQSLLFPKDFSSIEEAPFIIEYVREPIKKVIEKFPEKEKEIRAIIFKEGVDVSLDSYMTYIEYWEGDVVMWKYNDLFLGGDKNPNWDWNEREKDEDGKTSKFPPNHFKAPQKPYIQLNFLGLGENIADETTLPDQSKTLQDSVNKRKRVVELNADFANGKFVVAGNAMSESDFDKINGDTYKIYLDKADTTAGAIDVFSGRALDQGIFQDGKDSELHIDNIFGTHSTTRGERTGQETATGRVILKESDTGRVDVITVNIEQFAEEYFNAEIQMLKINLSDRYDVYSIPDDLDVEKLTAEDQRLYIDKEELADVRIFIKTEEGSTAVQNKAQQQATAVDLAIQGLMWSGDMYEILGYPNSRQLAKNAFLAANNPVALYPELENPEKFEPDAIRHITEMLGGSTNEDIEIFDSQDLEDYQKHIDTQTDYMKGIEVYEDLVSFSDLDIETQEIFREHHDMELTQLGALLTQSQEINPLAMLEQVAGQMPSDGANTEPINVNEVLTPAI